MSDPRTGIVVIGRNEGERLKACLRSVTGTGPVVYVDSGSVDGSQAFARGQGVHVVELAVPPGFTAARARNAGAAMLIDQAPTIEFIQFVDGDCEVREGWIDRAMTTLDADPQLALVFGRRRERFPERSVYNALCDDEWDVPVGDVGACGGDILIHRSAFAACGGYPDEMIAGEEPDMSMRLRALGWRLARIEGEMTLHDAAILRFGQWWRRTRRAGHAFAELARRHPFSPSPDWRASVRRDILWGAIVPGIGLAGLLLAIATGHVGWSLLTLAAVGLMVLNMARIYVRRRKEGLPPRLARASALLLMVGKIAEAQGVADFHRHRLRGRRGSIIEYKEPVA